MIASPRMFSIGEPAFRLASALAIGLLIGAERERRKGEGPLRSAAGIRTFALASLLGGVSVVLGGNLLLAVTTGIIAAFCIVAYLRTPIAVRLLGPRFGLPIAGLASGFVSSTATIGAMGALALQEPALARLAVAGAVLSTVATILQMTAVLAATNRATLYEMRFALAAAGIAALVYGAIQTLSKRAARNCSACAKRKGFQSKERRLVCRNDRCHVRDAAALGTVRTAAKLTGRDPRLQVRRNGERGAGEDAIAWQSWRMSVPNVKQVANDLQVKNQKATSSQ